MILDNKIDIDIVFQSFTSLLINFVGLFACGNIFNNVIDDIVLRKYP